MMRNIVNFTFVFTGAVFIAANKQQKYALFLKTPAIIPYIIFTKRKCRLLSHDRQGRGSICASGRQSLFLPLHRPAYRA